MGITDDRDQFYRTAAAGLGVDYNVLRLRAVGVSGGLVTQAHGLLGTGGEFQPVGQGSQYVTHF